MYWCAQSLIKSLKLPIVVTGLNKDGEFEWSTSDCMYQNFLRISSLQQSLYSDKFLCFL